MGIVETVAEDALTAVVPAAGWPLKILGWVKAVPSGAIAVIKSHPLAALLAVSLIGNAVQWHLSGVHERATAKQIAAWQSAFDQEQKAVLGWKAVAGVYAGAVKAQNASIAHLADVSAAKQRAAQSALQAAVRRNAGYAAHIDALGREASDAPALGNSCPDGAAVLAAKGDL